MTHTKSVARRRTPGNAGIHPAGLCRQRTDVGEIRTTNPISSEESLKCQTETDRWTDVSSADSIAVVPVSTGTTAWRSVDGLADPVVAIDADGVLHYANDTAAEVLGWDAHRTAGEFGPGAGPSRRPQPRLGALRTIVTKSVGDLISLRLRTGHGTWRYLELRGTLPRRRRRRPVRRADRDRRPRRHRASPSRVRPGRHRGAASGHGEHARHGRAGRLDGLVRSVNGAVTRFLGHDPETRPRPVDPRATSIRTTAIRCSIAAVARAPGIGHARCPRAHGSTPSRRVRVHGHQPARRSGRQQLRDQRADR